MVRKMRLLLIAVALVLCVAAPATAASPEIYDGNISTSILDYFSDILSKVNPLKNYVLIRNSQYNYNLYVGEIAWNGNQFTADTADVYSIQTNTGYNGSYTFHVSSVSDLRIIPDDHLLYSDLGPYPALVDSSVYWSCFLSITLWVIILSKLIRSILLWR